MTERYLSKLLRAVREKRGLTQSELGKLCGFQPAVAQPAVARWETGAHAVSEDTLVKVAEGLGVTVEQLLREGLRALRK